MNELETSYKNFIHSFDDFITAEQKEGILEQKQHDKLIADYNHYANSAFLKSRNSDNGSNKQNALSRRFNLDSDGNGGLYIHNRKNKHDDFEM